MGGENPGGPQDVGDALHVTGCCVALVGQNQQLCLQRQHWQTINTLLQQKDSTLV